MRVTLLFSSIFPLLKFCYEWNTSASSRKDKEHQKTAIDSIAVLIYDAVHPFQLGAHLFNDFFAQSVCMRNFPCLSNRLLINPCYSNSYEAVVMVCLNTRKKGKQHGRYCS